MQVPTHQEVLDAIDSFLVRHDMRPSRFGREATGEPQLIASLRAMRSPRLNLLERVSSYMRDRDAAAGFAPPDDHATAPQEAA